MAGPQYIDMNEAREVLGAMGVDVSERQIRRAAEPDAQGRRRLPFFIDPIEGRLKIEKGTLVNIYRMAQAEAEKRIKPS